MSGFVKKVLFNASSSFLVQFSRYIVVGGIASIADISIFTFLTNIFLVNHILSNTIAFAAGLTVNYYLSMYWVFGIRERHTIDFFMFAITGILGLLLSNVILFLLIDLGLLAYILGSANNKILNVTAKLIAVFVVLFWNFIARRKLVFKTA